MESRSQIEIPQAQVGMAFMSQFPLPQAGAQLQVFDMFDGDADGRKFNKSSNSNVSFQIGLTGGKQSPYWCFSLTRAA